MFSERIDVESYNSAVGAADFLCFEVDRQCGVGAALCVVGELVEFGLRNPDGQDAVLETVIVEDIREARRDDAAHAIIQQCPGRVFAR